MSVADRLTRLGEVLIALSGSPVPTHLFQALAEHAPGALPADYLAVCLADADADGYLVHSLSAIGAAGPAGRLFRRHEGLPGRAMRSGRACVTGDLATEPDGVADLEGALAGAGLGGALAVPVRSGAQVLGALLFACRPPAAYGDDDVHIASLMAAGVAAALETSRLYQALADERSTLAAVLGSTQDAVVVVNEDGAVVLANPAVRPMLGLVGEALGGQPFATALAHPPLRELFEERRLGISELPLPDGRTAQASLVPVTSAHGEAIGVAAILRDITVLKHLEQMKNDFVNTVSHDLKNPIMVISTTADLMRVAGADDAKHDERCARIAEMARYMSELVTDLLDLGKIQAGLEATPEPLELAALVEDTLRMLGPHATAKHISLSVELPSAVSVAGHPARLKQALLNLVGNAIKYTPEGGTVAVSVSLAPEGGPAMGRTAVIAVRDSGIGIPARDLPHVFDKFYRVRSSATDAIPGTGLGLAIVKGIVEAHRGHIRVESVEGKGSTFTVELPLARE